MQGLGEAVAYALFGTILLQAVLLPFTRLRYSPAVLWFFGCAQGLLVLVYVALPVDSAGKLWTLVLVPVAIWQILFARRLQRARRRPLAPDPSGPPTEIAR